MDGLGGRVVARDSTYSAPTPRPAARPRRQEVTAHAIPSDLAARPAFEGGEQNLARLRILGSFWLTAAVMSCSAGPERVQPVRAATVAAFFWKATSLADLSASSGQTQDIDGAHQG